MEDKSNFIINTELVPVRIVDALNKYLEIGKMVFKEYINSNNIFRPKLLTDVYEFSYDMGHSSRITRLCYEYNEYSDKYVCWFRGYTGIDFNRNIISTLKQLVGESNVTTDINRPYELILDDLTIDAIHRVCDMSEEEFRLYLKMMDTVN